MKTLVIIAKEADGGIPVTSDYGEHSLKLVTPRWVSESVSPHDLTGHYKDGDVTYRLIGRMNDEGAGILSSPDHAGHMSVVFAGNRKPKIGDCVYFTDTYGEEWEYVIESTIEPLEDIH